MINKNTFTQIAKKIKQSNKKVKNPQIMHPTREWFIGLSFSVLAFVLIAIWSSNTYVHYKEISQLEGSSKQDQPVVYRESMVNSALEDFSNRTDRHSELLNSIGSSLPTNTSTSSESEIDSATTTTTEETATSAQPESEPDANDAIEETNGEEEPASSEAEPSPQLSI